MDDHSRFGPEHAAVTELAQATSTDPIGQVDVVKGGAQIIRVDGTKVAAEAGMPIFQGDTLETEGEGSIGLVFVDQSTFALAENGRMTIDEMVFDPVTEQGNSLYNVTQGVFTFVSGEIAKYSVDAMLIDTPLATIGIRGTAGGGRINNPQATDPNSDVPPSGTFSNFRDPLTGQSGEMTIITPTGVQILNIVNATTNVSNPFVPPSTPVILPTAALQGVFGRSLGSLPRPNVNQPGQSGANEGGASNRETDLLTPDAPNADNAAQQEAVDAAAAAAFEEALALGLDAGAALELATQVAEQSLIRFGVQIENLDSFNEQSAINDIVGNTLNQSLGGIGVLGATGPFATDGANISGDGGVDSLNGGAGGDLLGGEFLSGFGPLGEFDPLAPLFGPAPEFLTGDGFIDDPTSDILLEQSEVASAVSDTITLTGGTQSVTLRSGISDIVQGDTGNDSVTFMSAAEAGDVFNGNGGIDSVTLFNSANTIQINDVSSLNLAYNETSDISAGQNIQWGSAGSMTVANWDSSTAGPRAPFSLSGIGSGGDNNLNQTVTLGFQLNNTNAQNSSFSLSDGTDTVILAVGTNTVASATGVDVWQLQNGTNTFTLTPAMSGQTITGSTGADTINVNGVGSADTINLGAGADILEVASGSGTPTVNGGATGEGNIFRLTGANTLSDAAFTNVTAFDTFEFGTNASFSITAGSNFDAAFLSAGDIDVTFTSGITSVTAVFNGASLTSALSYAGAANGGVDTVTGGSAADVIVTGGGADVVVGGGGNDTFRLAAATDLASGSVYNGGAGTDIFDVAGSIGSITLDFTSVTLTSVETFDFSNASQVASTFSSSQLGSISTITGTSGSDTLTLSSGGDISAITVNNFENVVLGGSGVTFSDSSGSHTITGTAGADNIDISTGGNDAVATGAGGAAVTAGSNFDANDSITGVSGTTDSLTLAGDYSGGLTLSNITNIDLITLTDANSYNFTLTSTTADAANGLTVTAAALTGSNTLTVNGTASDDNLTLTGGAGADTLTGGTGNDTISGNGGSDSIDITQGGTDSVTTGAGGATITAGANFTSADTITGTQGVADTLGLSGNYSGGVTLSNISEIDTINVADGNSYNFTLAAGTADTTNGLTINGSSLTGTNALSINGVSSNDVLTLTGGGAADTLVGGTQGDVISGGAGVDAITGGGGADNITTGAGADTITINAVSEFGDTVTDFTAGGGGDILDINTSVNRGTGTVFEALTTLSTLGTNTGLINYTTNIASYTNAVAVATALSTLTTLSAGNTALFIASNGTNSHIWRWTDGAGGSSDSVAVAGEMTSVAELTGVDNANLTAANFADFA
jgi:Ca2+-binding RTX toxin-like protein